jgi:16S rRNA (cytosine1402-N4)-methyltransferase
MRMSAGGLGSSEITEPEEFLRDGSALLHRSVLLAEVLDALRPRPGGYVALDCTINGGGHSYGLLERSAPDGQVVGLDADAAALALAANRLAPFAGRFRLVNRNFRELADVAAELSLVGVDGVVFDLGISSLQLERFGRGFSFRGNEPLDMRLDPASNSPTAADLLNTLPEAELGRIFRTYGEEPRARKLASVVVHRRQRASLARTGDLVAAVTQALGPQRGRIHPATRAFQALRIAVNDELAALEAGLTAAVRLLDPGGRLAVISFHSLEDRIVKWRFREWSLPSSNRPALVRVLTRKPIVPAIEEIASNPRARSAKLRVAERLPTTINSPIQTLPR